ncbi:MAG: lysophospholipid acyltransferase family protein [bacterium]|nr:lysophospholipid acyltransferase family protein [bacterium]
MSIKRTFKHIYRKILVFISPVLGSMFVKFIGWTTKIDFVDKHYEEELKRNGTRIIYTFWHNRIFFTCFYYRHRGIRVLVSPSRDGEYTTRIIEAVGYKTIRGSSFTDGRRALNQMIEAVREGHDTGFTPDGPRGPKYEVQPGVVLLAKKTGAAILPLIYDVKKKKVFKSWDNFILPLPFNHAVFVYGRPIFVPESARGEEIREIQNKLKQSLDAIVVKAEEYFNK